MRVRRPLSKALACLLCACLTGGSASAAGPRLAAGRPAPAAGRPMLEIRLAPNGVSGTWSVVRGYDVKMSVNGMPVGVGGLTAAGAILPVSDESAEQPASAEQRVGAALEKTRLALAGEARDPGEAPAGRVELRRPASSESDSGKTTRPQLEASSKKISALKNLLAENPRAAAREASRRLTDSADTRSEVRADAARLLIQHGRGSAGYLISYAMQRNSNWHVLRELAWGAGLRAPLENAARPRLIKTLRKLLESDNDSVHLMAHWALRQYGEDPGAERAVTPPPAPQAPAPPAASSRAVKWVFITFLAAALGFGAANMVAHYSMPAPIQAQTQALGGSEGRLMLTPEDRVPGQEGTTRPQRPELKPSQPANTPDALAEIAANTRAIAGAMAKMASNQGSGWGSLMLTMLLSMAAMIGAMWIFQKMMGPKGPRGGGGGSSRGAPVSTSVGSRHDPAGDLSFDEIAGIDEAREQLRDVVEYLKAPGKYAARHAKAPLGTLLIGPPGTGKTLLAQTMAKEAGVPFFSASASEFVEMYVGVGAARVRDLFDKAKAAKKAVVFIDEIDAVAKKRGFGGGGNDEREQTLNQLLVELTDIQNLGAEYGIVVLAATNTPEVLDPALLRPGRFDSHVDVGAPDVVGREAILQIHARKTRLAPDADLRLIAQRATGLTGAYLAGIVNHANLNSIKHGRSAITAEDLDYGFTKVTVGDKRHKLISAAEKKVIAAHEAGHIVTGRRNAKVTIVPHGRALGYAEPVETEERYLQDEDDLKQEMVVLMGGRAAEKLLFNKFSSGADNDLERATRVARMMVGRWGMGSGTGFAQMVAGPGEQPLSVSDQTQREFDLEVKRLLDEAQAEATRRIQARRPQFERLSKELLERETLYLADIERIVGQEPAR